jgi:hypothetical protein
MNQPHILKFIERSREFLARPPDISFWHAIEASSPSQRDR